MIINLLLLSFERTQSMINEDNSLRGKLERWFFFSYFSSVDCDSGKKFLNLYFLFELELKWTTYKNNDAFFFLNCPKNFYKYDTYDSFL